MALSKSIDAFASSHLYGDVTTVAFAVDSKLRAVGHLGAPDGWDKRFAERQGFGGKLGETLVVPGTNGLAGVTLVAVGVGDSTSLTTDDLRRAASAAVKAVWSSSELTIDLVDANKTLTVADAAAAVVEGAVLTSYTYDDYRSSTKPCALTDLVVISHNPKAVDTGIDFASLSTTSTLVARDLVNGPPDEVDPAYLLATARSIAAASRGTITVEAWDRARMRRERMGGIVGVAEGTDNEPYYIEMRYRPRGAKPRAKVALVGKGITFDSGGLSLKSGEGMMTMKCDMGGAAAVLGAMTSIAELAPRVEVYAIICATENLPGPKAIMPGDVLRARNGKTVEVLNTDAEGRLVLMDGLSRAVELGVDEIVDLATLTGAQVVALGNEVAAVLSNRDELVDKIREAGDRAGESFWQLPLTSRYRKHIDSPVADMKNIGRPGQAGTTIGGLFLQEFVGDTPWAHLDIAGPAFGDGDSYITRGGSGFGARTLLEYLRAF
jgi:leucyl aminopeptidase